ncbi:GNAT family N-acetyltransferase [Ruminococcaceae bacterium OttesenSCG-928-I18]|nr:GNAT family N-acetyltransferase [Ruminococcaceae bacterium OttesenSCG-928-I18]
MLCQISLGSAHYRQALALRSKVLRDPLGLCLSEEDLESDPVCLHLAALRGGRLIGAVVLEPKDHNAYYLKQMAIDPEEQGHGVGRALLRQAESLAAAKGGKRIYMQARMTARGFYEKLGYAPVGESQIFIGIPHIKMEKML